MTRTAIAAGEPERPDSDAALHRRIEDALREAVRIEIHKQARIHGGITPDAIADTITAGIAVALMAQRKQIRLRGVR
jgi:hypothetical protein